MLDPLFAPIDPSSSRISVMSTKIEIALRKQVPGQKWSSLEASSPAAMSDEKKNPSKSTASSSNMPTNSSNTPSSTIPAPAMTTTASAPDGPVYPTSSRQGVKDWDKIATDLTQKKKKKSSKPRKSEGGNDKSENTSSSDDGDGADSEGAESVDSDHNSGDPVDSFFKKLYANADPDTRRAMVKSFTESEGTALSTNWSEVQMGKVETRPPAD